MTLAVGPEPVPLAEDAHGTVRVGGTRVTLETVVSAFDRGDSPEEIREQFSSTITDAAGTSMLLVKGGSSLELRRGIAGSRTSKDLDAVTRADIETVHERLADAGEEGWSGFTAIFTPPEEIDVPGLLVKPRRFTAK